MFSMFSDIENLDIMLGGRHSQREESVISNHARRPESMISNLFGNNEENLYLNPRENESGDNAGLTQDILQVLTQMLRSTDCQVI